jgi:hypothetical protein
MWIIIINCGSTNTIHSYLSLLVKVLMKLVLLFTFVRYNLSLHHINFFITNHICIMVHTPIEYSNSGSSWSYGSWIYNYLCNQCLSPLIDTLNTHIHDDHSLSWVVTVKSGWVRLALWTQSSLLVKLYDHTSVFHM